MTILQPNPDRDSEPLWAALREHRIELQRCASCGRRWWPRTPSCPYCGSVSTGVIHSNGAGTVYSYVGVNRALSDAMRDQAPYVIATVDLDDGARVFGRIVGPHAVAIGRRVRPTFCDHGEWSELRFEVDA